jgi:putative transposase
MPWKETGPMDERVKFIGLYLEADHSVAELSREFGVSRKTAYKWIDRYRSEGIAGLAELSRAPHCQAARVSSMVEEAVIEMRTKKPSHGPKKIRQLLKIAHPEIRCPAVSTIGEILKRNGLVVPRRRSRKSAPYEQPLLGCDQSNSVWSADFKGWFRARNGERCDPLTITDNFSRYLLRCQLVRSSRYEAVKPIFIAAFQEYGLPMAIRTDNGTPFASTAVGGLSKLSIWWIRLGIIPERIQPGKPQQNPRHERMHRTLKAETAKPPKSSRKQQQIAFDRFRQEYNEERPHEGIEQRFPAELYQPSLRHYPLRLPPIDYPEAMQVRSVRMKGDIPWKGERVYLSQTLSGERVGLRNVGESLWDIYFGPVRLAQLDTRKMRIIHLKRHRSRDRRKRNKQDHYSKKVLPM